MTDNMDICNYLEQQKGIALSEQQREAVNAPCGKVLLLAVPGAGKTTVVTARAAGLIQGGTPPEQLLILTFNRAAAKDMEHRWNSLFSYGESGLDVSSTRTPHFSTIHSFCYRLLREYARLRGTRVPRLLEGEGTGGRGRVLSGIYRELTGQFLPDEQLGQLENLIGYCVNMQCTPEDTVAEQNAQLEHFPEIYRRYTAWKRENDLMDFDDMLLFAYTALLRSISLREQIAGAYSHILVDEAQDTSKLQQELIALLVRENLFMVGDEDQSIYGFRGAYPKGLISFFERYPEGKLLKLEQNYRSTPQIVAAADKVIRTNTMRFPKTPFTSRVDGAAVELITDIPMERQYREIASRCVQAAREGSCAVLYRNSFSGIGIAAELERLGAPYWASETRLGYQNDFITRDVSNILRLAVNPGDMQAFHQVYFRLGCGISRELATQAEAAPRTDMLQWIIDSGEAYERSTGKLLFVQRILRRMAKKSPVYQIDDIMEELGYLETLEKRGPTGYLMSSYLQRLSIIRRFAEQCDDTAELLERLSCAEKLLDRRVRSPIRLSTVHSAKGQEYGHVFIADALEGIFPASDVVEYNSLGNKEQMEEETRLFYTAMTRAKNRLTIFAPEEGFGRELLAGRFLAAAQLLGAEATAAGGALEGIGISHTFFGAGTIVEINRSRRLLTVDFKHYGRKSFGLESLSNPKLFKLFR
ncbi:MAG: ATP-dependent helicase [Angelakisella sp.]